MLVLQVLLDAVGGHRVLGHVQDERAAVSGAVLILRATTHRRVGTQGVRGLDRETNGSCSVGDGRAAHHERVSLGNLAGGRLGAREVVVKVRGVVGVAWHLLRRLRARRQRHVDLPQR